MKGKQKNGSQLLLPAALVALFVAVLGAGFAVESFNAGANTGSQGNSGAVQVPGYLQKGGSNASEGSQPELPDGIISFAADDSGSKTRLLSVTGTVTKSEAADKAVILLSVETLDKVASKSQSDNAELSSQVVEALKGAGIAEDNIKTASYSLSEEFQWNETLRKSESIGYRTTNTIQVEVDDLGRTGSVIDAAVRAGANRVSSVSFELSAERQAALKAEALKEAAENARAKASSIASGLGVSVGQVYSASESSNYYIPVYKSYPAAVAADASGAATPIIPGNIEFSATVSVQFEIQ